MKEKPCRFFVGQQVRCIKVQDGATELVGKVGTIDYITPTEIKGSYFCHVVFSPDQKTERKTWNFAESRIEPYQAIPEDGYEDTWV